ncbi:MAG TPA: ATP-binding cassette domain-containing protein [Candidatus Saccharimonadales bacterium]|nr:ATP-binding cassette domain-containing protein [Candidatus Saccharimonadales bacterium]
MESAAPEKIVPAGIQFKNIDKRYGGLYALRRVTLDVAGGECVVLAGRNGSGKTTLLRIAARLVRPSAGSVSFPVPDSPGNEDVRPGYVAHATMVYDELTAAENLLLFSRLQGERGATERVDKILCDVGLAERKTSLVRTFSRGMRQRIAIARALLLHPSILLLDEPATGLDPQGVAWLAETLRGLRNAGCTILMSLHGESEISSLATRAVRLDAGSLVADSRTGVNIRSILTFADA